MFGGVVHRKPCQAERFCREINVIIVDGIRKLYSATRLSKIAESLFGQPNPIEWSAFMINLRPATVSRLRDRLKQTGARPSIVISSDQDVLAKAGLLPPEERTAVQGIDPIVETMFLMMAADGTVGEDEYNVIRGAVRELTENSIRTTTLNAMLESYQQALEKEGQQARIESIAHRLGDDEAGCESAFVLAAAVAFADEVIDDTENELLNTFAEAIGLSEDRANELLDELEGDWQNDD